MPWKECEQMDERLKFVVTCTSEEKQRVTKHVLPQ